MLKRKPDIQIVFSGVNGKDGHTFIDLTKGHIAIINLADEDLGQMAEIVGEQAADMIKDWLRLRSLKLGL